MSLDQLKALDKLLPDSGQVRCVHRSSWHACMVCELLPNESPLQIEMIKGYHGDLALLGTAEDFFRRLLQVKQ